MTSPVDAPIWFAEKQVLPEWVDFNGHMNVAFYLMAFDHCVDDLYNRLGIGPAQLDQRRSSVFTLEAHISYVREVVEGDPLRISGRLMDYDGKRVHSYYEMYHGGEEHLVAALEQIGMHVDLEARKTIPFSGDDMETLERMMAAHRDLPKPEYAGRVIGIRRK
jgi:acyl-CoA thioester hydrolase